MGGDCYAVDGYIVVHNTLEAYAPELRRGHDIDLDVLMKIAEPMVRIAQRFLEEDAKRGIPYRPIAVVGRYHFNDSVDVSVGALYVPGKGVVAIAGGFSSVIVPRPPSPDHNITPRCYTDYVIYLDRTRDVLHAAKQVAELTPRKAFPKIPTTA